MEWHENSNLCRVLGPKLSYSSGWQLFSSFLRHSERKAEVYSEKKITQNRVSSTKSLPQPYCSFFEMYYVIR